jgi:hypothetical protein
MVFFSGCKFCEELAGCRAKQGGVGGIAVQTFCSDYLYQGWSYSHFSRYLRGYV